MAEEINEISKIADAADLSGAAAFDPSMDLDPFDNQPLKPTPPKDPATGQFVSPNPAPAQAPAQAATEATPPTNEPAAPPAAAPQAKHPSYLMRQANSFNISPEEANEMTFEQLTRAIELEISARREQPTAAAQTQTNKPSAKDPFLESLEGLEADGFDSRLVGGIKSLKAELDQTKQQLSVMTQREQARLYEERDRVFDNAFKAAGVAELGVQAGHEMDPKSTEFQRRIAIIRMAEADPAKDSMQTKLDRAIKLLYSGRAAAPAAAGDPPADPVTQKLNQRRTEWEQGGLHRPTSRTIAEPKGEAAAVKKIKEKLVELGEDEFTDHEANLPG